MRLIDADALEYTRVRIFHGLNEDGTPCVGGWNAVLMSSTIKDAPTVDAVPVVKGRWEWFEEWNLSTSDHPRELDACGWRCCNCKKALADMVGGYWDNPDENPKLRFCPNCGAEMDGGISDA